MAKDEATLYTIPGSVSCQKAEHFLKETGVRFKIVAIQNTDHLESVGRDIDAHKLPLFVTPDTKLEGLQEIMLSVKQSK